MHIAYNISVLCVFIYQTIFNILQRILVISMIFKSFQIEIKKNRHINKFFKNNVMSRFGWDSRRKLN